MRPVNLLPEQHRKRSVGEAPPVQSYAALGVLGCVLLMVLVYVLTANQATSRKTEAAKAQQEATTLEAKSTTLSPFGNFAQTKEARLGSVRELAAGRFDWERFIRELALVLPRGSWVNEVDASVTGADDSGGAGGAAAGQPSAKLTGCAPHQPDVAKMMVRLRRLHRAEDVTLAESAQEETGGAPSLNSCGRYYAFDITVAFSAAPPPHEAPRGATRVPAYLGGGS